MTQVKRPRTGGFTLLELIVTFALLLIAAAFLIPMLHQTHHGEGGSNHVKCASNLKQIGLAMLLYANENRGHLPRVVYVATPPATPLWGTGAAATDPFAADGPQPNDVSAAMFLLLRTQDITSGVFVCPSSNAEADDFGGGSNTSSTRSNFTNVKKNLSYSMQNPYPIEGAIEKAADGWWSSTLGAEFAIAADINPGTAGGADVRKPTYNSTATEIKVANSANHDGDGQNVMYNDGHVEWAGSPFVGVNKDNIYTTGKAEVIASPMDVNDSVLLPTDD